MKILIPTDYSENAYTAFEYAYQLYPDNEHDFILLNAQNARHAGAILTVDLNKDLVKQSHHKMDALVKSIRKKYERINIQGLVSAGTFLDTVVEKTDEFSIDLIVIGTKGASGVEHVLMGSNATNLIGHSPKPLIVVPQKTHLSKPSRFLMAADFVDQTNPDTFDTLLNLCYTHNVHLDILHVAKPNESRFTEKNIPFNTEGLDYTLYERVDQDVEYAIIDFVQEKEIDLIALLKSKGGFIHDLFHSSLTKKLGMHSDTPLLVMV